MKAHLMYDTITLLQSAKCAYGKEMVKMDAAIRNQSVPFCWFDCLLHSFATALPASLSRSQAKTWVSPIIRPIFPSSFANSSNRPTSAENMSISPDYFHSNLRGFMGLRNRWWGWEDKTHLIFQIDIDPIP